MTQFSNTDIECYVAYQGQLVPLHAVTVSSFSLHATAPLKRSLASGQWQNRQADMPQRQLHIQLSMLKHDELADVMIQNAAIAGTPLDMQFKLDVEVALQAMMHIEHYQCNFAQNALAKVTLRCVNLGQVQTVML
jgi:hypothetical protein